jgi:hypothetical protein
MTKYLTNKERERKELKEKEQYFKRSMFGSLKNFYTRFIDGVSITKNYSEVIQTFKESGLASSLDDAEKKIKKFLAGEDMDLVGEWHSKMSFEDVTNERGDKKVRISYWGCD